MTIQAPHPAAIQMPHPPTVGPRDARAASARAALIAGVCGLLANVAYVVVAAMPADHVAAPFVASVFGPLIAVTSVALYVVLASERATLAGQLAAVANVAAGALVTAMLLVQIAVDDVEARLSSAVNDAFEHVEFALDLSWDVFLVAGTILFACAMFADRRFGRRFAVPGIALAVALYVLNFASFPTPPADAGSLDLGPFVGLWYAAVSVQALRLRRVSGRRDGSTAGGGSRRKKP